MREGPETFLIIHFATYFRSFIIHFATYFRFGPPAARTTMATNSLSWLLSGATKSRAFITALWAVMPKGFELPGVLISLLLLSVALRTKYSIYSQDKHRSLVRSEGVTWLVSWALFLALPITPWLVDLAITLGLLALNLRTATSAVDGFGFSLSGAQFWLSVAAQLICIAISIYFNVL